MEPYSVQVTVVNDSNKDVEDELTKSVVNGEETAPGGDDCALCTSLPEFTIEGKKDQNSTSPDNNSLLLISQNRDPFTGFWGKMDFYLNNGVSNGIRYDIQGNPLGMASIGGTSPDIIGGPLLRGDKIIKLGKYAFNSRFFHRVFKPKILAKVGNYSKIVGNNPDISVNGISIVLNGAKNGPFKGNSLKTTLTIFDLIF